MKHVSFIIAFWLPCFFAAALCSLPLIGERSASWAFYSFLPLAFLLVALAFGRLYAVVLSLQAQVESLKSAPKESA